MTGELSTDERSEADLTAGTRVEHCTAGSGGRSSGEGTADSSDTNAPCTAISETADCHLGSATGYSVRQWQSSGSSLAQPCSTEAVSSPAHDSPHAVDSGCSGENMPTVESFAAHVDITSSRKTMEVDKSPIMSAVTLSSGSPRRSQTDPRITHSIEPFSSSVSCAMASSEEELGDSPATDKTSSSGGTSAADSMTKDHQNPPIAVDHELSHEEQPLQEKNQLVISEMLDRVTHPTDSSSVSDQSAWSSASLQELLYGEVCHAVDSTNDNKQIVSSEQSSVEAVHPTPMLESAPQSVCPSDLLASVAEDASRQGSMQGSPQQVLRCRSSPVFIPRGLSQWPLQPDRSNTDLAPDLEMDLYGISYSLDESLGDTDKP